MNLKRFLAVVLCVLIVASLFSISISANEEGIESALAGDFTAEAFYNFCDDTKNKVTFDPIPIITFKHDQVLITKVEETSDENGKYHKPVTKDGKPVYIKPSDDYYYENMMEILQSNLTAIVESDARINNLFIAMKLKNESGRGHHFTAAKMIKSQKNELYKKYSYSDYIFEEHPLFGLSPGSIIIYDSNLNFNVYDVKTGEFRLVESGCVNPDIYRDKETLHLQYPELLWFLDEMYLPPNYGYLELFDGERNIITDGEGTRSDINFKVIDGIPTIENYYTLASILDMRASLPDDNGVIRFYKLLDDPSGDDFYRILEIQENSKEAKIITADGEKEFELSFAPYPKDEKKKWSTHIYPLLDILNALQITYHYPRCDGSILISLNKGW